MKRREGIRQDAEDQRDGMTMTELANFLQIAHSLGVAPNARPKITTDLRGRIKSIRTE